MKNFILALLDCPECRKGSLKLKTTQEQEGEIISGEISCSCGKVYPVVNGIPRFLKDYHKSSQVQKRFEHQWKKWGRDEVIFGRTKEESKKFFIDFSGSAVNPEYLKGKISLDGGCGHGRFTEIMAEFGAFSVGLDIGSGVEIARQRVNKYPKN